MAGLRSRGGDQYNGVTGVVVGPEGEGGTGRLGVRLDAPFAGKVRVFMGHRQPLSPVFAPLLGAL